MVGTAYSGVAQRNAGNIRKALQGSVFVAPSTATAITALTGTDSLIAALPAGFTDLGYTTKDGASMGRAVDSSDTTSWGATDPTRRDVTSDVSTVHVVCQETKALTLGLYLGLDTSTVVPVVASGETQITKPLRPLNRYYRVLVLGVDANTSGEIYMGVFYPYASITNMGDVEYQDGQEVRYDLTFTAYPDATLGYAAKWIYAGLGWKALVTATGNLGFATPA
jgi:hypothetical protein